VTLEVQQLELRVQKHGPSRRLAVPVQRPEPFDILAFQLTEGNAAD